MQVSCGNPESLVRNMPHVSDSVLKGIGENEGIWRYMSLEKFESMLERRALYFCRTDRFEDQWEAVIPEKQFNQSKIDEYIDRTRVPEFVKTFEKRSFAASMDAWKVGRNRFLVNCWHIGEVESDALWKIYADRQQTVAIQSRFGRLSKAFHRSDCDVRIGKVSYVDLQRTSKRNGAFKRSRSLSALNTNLSGSFER